MLSNLASFNPGGITNQVATIYLGDAIKAEPPKPPAAPRTYVALEPGVIDRLVGNYRLSDMLIQVVKQDGKLMAAPMGSMLLELKPLSATRYYAEQMQAEVEFTPKGEGGMSLKPRSLSAL